MKEHRRSVNGCLKRCLDRLTQDTTPSSDRALSTSSSKNQSDSHQAGDPQSSDSDVYRLRKFIQSVNSHSGGEVLSAAGRLATLTLSVLFCYINTFYTNKINNE